MARCDQNETNTQRGILIELDFKDDSGALGYSGFFKVLDLRAVAGVAKYPETLHRTWRPGLPVGCCGALPVDGIIFRSIAIFFAKPLLV